MLKLAWTTGTSQARRACRASAGPLADTPHARILPLATSRASASRTVGASSDVERRIVQQQEVEVVGAQPARLRSVEATIAAAEKSGGLVPGLVAGLGRQHDLVADAAQRLADQLLAMAVAVGRRRVEEGDSAVMRAGEGRERRAVVGIAVGGLARRCARRCPRRRSRSRRRKAGLAEAAGSSWTISSARRARA